MIYKEKTFVKYAQKKMPTKHLEKRSKTLKPTSIKVIVAVVIRNAYVI